MSNPILEAAAKLIEHHIQRLDTRQSKCPCCGMVKYDNFDDYRSHVELSAMINKLRNRFK